MLEHVCSSARRQMPFLDLTSATQGRAVWDRGVGRRWGVAVGGGGCVAASSGAHFGLTASPQEVTEPICLPNLVSS